MDKLIVELIDLLRVILATQERLLQVAGARREAMRTFNLELLNGVLERERHEIAAMADLEKQRRAVVEKVKRELPRGVEATTSEIARRVGEPARTQILALAAQIREVTEALQRANKINQSASQGIAGSIGKIIKIVTGVTQHAGLYMRNGRKAAMSPLHVLDAVG